MSKIYWTYRDTVCSTTPKFKQLININLKKFITCHKISPFGATCGDSSVESPLVMLMTNKDPLL